MDFAFSPLTNWNDWRNVEEKLMKDENLWDAFVFEFEDGADAPIVNYMKADLPSRARALYVARTKKKAVGGDSQYS